MAVTRVLLLLFAVALPLVLGDPYSNTASDGSGFNGQDMVNGDLNSVTASSPLDCAKACDSNGNCAVWAYATCGEKTCWLKNSGAATRGPASCREIGFRSGNSVDYSGGDLPNQPTNLGSNAKPADCAKLCRTTKSCVAWAFDSCGNQNCWLKEKVLSSGTPNNCRVSAIEGSLGLDIYGGDISSVALGATATTTDCANSCFKTPGCNAWAFTIPGTNCETNNNCWLKKVDVNNFPKNAQACRASGVINGGTSGGDGGNSGNGGGSVAKIGYVTNVFSGPGVWSTGKIGWYYNWDSTPISGANKQFVPMIWSPNSDHVNNFNNNLNSGALNNSPYLLAFNEPDNGGQSNMNPQQGATSYKQLIQPHGDKFKLGAPAISSADSNTGWLTQFFSACDGCQVDFIPIHWYGCDANEFQNYVSGVWNRYNKHLWITEYACAQYGSCSCDQASVNRFMTQTTAWLDSQSFVDRYSWFGVRVSGIPDTNSLLNGDNNGLTDLGNQYINGGGH